MGETLSTELKKIRKAELTWGRRKSRAVFSGPFGAPERISKQTKQKQRLVTVSIKGVPRGKGVNVLRNDNIQFN